jgi:hypothetical protein
MAAERRAPTAATHDQYCKSIGAGPEQRLTPTAAVFEDKRTARLLDGKTDVTHRWGRRQGRDLNGD